LTLIYNLIRADQKNLSNVPDYQKEQHQVAKLFGRWRDNLKKQVTGEHCKYPKKLIYPLEHAYTPEALDFSSLKNVDVAIAQTLVSAAQQANCEIFLALLSVEESGTAEYNGYGGYGGHWSEPDESDFEVGEVYDRSAIISNWRSPDKDLAPGAGFPLTALPFEQSELCPENAFDDLQPDELEFHEATGNEGASFELQYPGSGRETAFVLNLHKLISNII